MDKWKEYGSYEAWKNSNNSSLQSDYDEHIESHYNWVEPDTYVSFDDFCMGKWQWL